MLYVSYVTCAGHFKPMVEPHFIMPSIVSRNSLRTTYSPSNDIQNELENKWRRSCWTWSQRHSSQKHISMAVNKKPYILKTLSDVPALDTFFLHPSPHIIRPHATGLSQCFISSPIGRECSCVSVDNTENDGLSDDRISYLGTSTENDKL